jgi:hypothetical protein
MKEFSINFQVADDEDVGAKVREVLAGLSASAPLIAAVAVELPVDGAMSTGVCDANIYRVA